MTDAHDMIKDAADVRVNMQAYSRTAVVERLRELTNSGVPFIQISVEMAKTIAYDLEMLTEYTGEIVGGEFFLPDDEEDDDA